MSHRDQINIIKFLRIFYGEMIRHEHKSLFILNSKKHFTVLRQFEKLPFNDNAVSIAKYHFTQEINYVDLSKYFLLMSAKYHPAAPNKTSLNELIKVSGRNFPPGQNGM
jgi:hypothetical protein